MIGRDFPTEIALIMLGLLILGIFREKLLMILLQTVDVIAKSAMLVAFSPILILMIILEFIFTGKTTFPDKLFKSKRRDRDDTFSSDW